MTEQVPECGRLLGVPAMAGGEPEPLGPGARCQGRGGRVRAQESRRTLCGDVATDLQSPGGVLLQRRGELIHEAGLVAYEARIVPREELELLGGLRVRLERVKMRVIRAEEGRQHVGVEGIALGGVHPVAVPRPVQGLGVDRVHEHPVIQEEVHHASVRPLDGRPEFRSPRPLLVQPTAPLGQALGRVRDGPLEHPGPLRVLHPNRMRRIGPVHPDVVPHRLSSLLPSTDPGVRNGGLALYRSSRGTTSH